MNLIVKLALLSERFLSKKLRSTSTWSRISRSNRVNFVRVLRLRIEGTRGKLYNESSLNVV